MPERDKDTKSLTERLAKLEQAQKDLEAERDQLKKANADLEAKVKAHEEPKPDPLEKVDPAVRKRVEELQKEAKAEREKREQADERIAKLEHEKQRELMIKRVATDLKGVGPADDVAARMLKIQGALTDEEFQEHWRELKALTAQVETGKLFAEIGKGGSGGEDGYEALADRLAKQYREKDPKLSYEQAFDQAMKDPEVMKRYAEAEAERFQKAKEG